MTDRMIIVLHAPEDAQDAFMIARELITPPRPFRDSQVRMLTAAENCRLPLGFEQSRLVVVTSITAVNSLAISRVLDTYLEEGIRENVLVIAASSVISGYDENSLISPILRYRRSPQSGLLEESGFHNTMIGDLRSETVGDIAVKIEHQIGKAGKTASPGRNPKPDVRRNIR